MCEVHTKVSTVSADDASEDCEHGWLEGADTCLHVGCYFGVSSVMLVGLWGDVLVPSLNVGQC